LREDHTRTRDTQITKLWRDADAKRKGRKKRDQLNNRGRVAPKLWGKKRTTTAPLLNIRTFNESGKAEEKGEKKKRQRKRKVK
jgi:hypothetical protein